MFWRSALFGRPTLVVIFFLLSSLFLVFILWVHLISFLFGSLFPSDFTWFHRITSSPASLIVFIVCPLFLHWTSICHRLAIDLPSTCHRPLSYRAIIRHLRPTRRLNSDTQSSLDFSSSNSFDVNFRFCTNSTGLRLCSRISSLSTKRPPRISSSHPNHQDSQNFEFRSSHCLSTRSLLDRFLTVVVAFDLNSTIKFQHMKFSSNRVFTR